MAQVSDSEYSRSEADERCCGRYGELIEDSYERWKRGRNGERCDWGYRHAITKNIFVIMWNHEDKLFMRKTESLDAGSLYILLWMY